MVDGIIVFVDVEFVRNGEGVVAEFDVATTVSAASVVVKDDDDDDNAGEDGDDLQERRTHVPSTNPWQIIVFKGNSITTWL